LIPAEHHSSLMQSLGNAGSRERWNRGCGHSDGEPVLSAEQIAELTPPEPAAAPAAPAPVTQRAKPATAAAPAPAPAEEQQQEPGDEEILQSELV
jgi:hypothetical protein